MLRRYDAVCKKTFQKMNTSRFTGKLAVVTGAASGIGLCTTKEFVMEGARVIMCDVDERSLIACASEIGDSVITMVGDVRDFEFALRVAEKAKELGGADYLVACAGGNEARCCKSNVPFYEQPLDVLNWGIDVNLKGPIYFSRAVMPQMVAKESGVIILLGSVTGIEGDGVGSMYGASKS